MSEDKQKNKDIQRLKSHKAHLSQFTCLLQMIFVNNDAEKHEKNMDIH